VLSTKQRRRRVILQLRHDSSWIRVLEIGVRSKYAVLRPAFLAKKLIAAVI
jgi:hypothetical protein